MRHSGEGEISGSGTLALLETPGKAGVPGKVSEGLCSARLIALVFSYNLPASFRFFMSYSLVSFVSMISFYKNLELEGKRVKMFSP